MVKVAIREEYAETLKSLGDLEGGVDLAVLRYAIEQITAKVNELRKKDAFYKARYGTDYPNFIRRIAEDEAFVQQVESKVSKIWETDLADWEFCFRGIEDWTRKLQKILLK